MLTTRYKHVINRSLQPLAACVARRGVHPSAITLGGLGLTGLACLVFVRSRAVGPFCVAMFLIGLLDGLDGAVARAGGKVTPFGAYLDAMCDRLIEVAVAISVAWVTGYWLLTTLVMVGSLLISYAKARAAMEVPVSNQEWPDLMERTERDVIFLAGLAAGQLFSWHPLGHDLFWWTLVVLVPFISVTVIQRMRRAHQFIQARFRPAGLHESEER